ncbi:MAG: D-amino acid aminotransferase [Gammaproteobacteria bacterium]|nr:D-amino acid aminotransferase [Gammaproteobacteria bacterium]
METVWLNGRFLPAAEAAVPVLDRGFIFGDGVYEVIPVFGNHILRLAEHLLRLRQSLAAIYMESPHTDAEWRGIIEGLLERNPGGRDRSIYLHVTRGVAPREHVSRAPLTPTVFAMCNPIPERVHDTGLSVVTHADIRWQRCDIKAISLLPGILLREHAQRVDGSVETILLRDGYLTEGAASNVFVVRKGEVRTPPKCNFILPGVTRDLVIELLRGANIPCLEAEVREPELFAADEIWLTSSTMGIAPVTRLDGKPVGAGRPGPVWRAADCVYQEFKQRLGAMPVAQPAPARASG